MRGEDYPESQCIHRGPSKTEATTWGSEDDVTIETDAGVMCFENEGRSHEPNKAGDF